MMDTCRRSALMPLLVLAFVLAACSQAGSTTSTSASASPSSSSAAASQSAAATAAAASESAGAACVDDETLALLEDNLGDLGALSESDLDRIASQMRDAEVPADTPTETFRDQVVEAIEAGDFSGIGLIRVQSGEVDLDAFGC